MKIARTKSAVLIKHRSIRILVAEVASPDPQAYCLLIHSFVPSQRSNEPTNQHNNCVRKPARCSELVLTNPSPSIDFQKSTEKQLSKKALQSKDKTHQT